MKTIKQLAVELNTTPQNIYAQLKRNNISLKDLKGKKQGKQVFYDENAELTIKRTFQTSQENVLTRQRDNEMIETLKSKIQQLERDNEALSRKLEEAGCLVREGSEEIARLRENEKALMKQVTGLIETERARAAIEAANANRKLISSAEDRKPGFFQRFLLMVKGNSRNDVDSSVEDNNK